MFAELSRVGSWRGVGAMARGEWLLKPFWEMLRMAVVVCGVMLGEKEEGEGEKKKKRKRGESKGGKIKESVSKTK